MKRVKDILAVLFLVFVLGSCSSVKTHAQNYTPKIKANSTVIITKNWNLNGKTVVLPEGVTLNVKNGVIQNGTLVGKKTKLAGKEKGVFNKVKIGGTWNVPTISSSLFVDLSEDNALRNVMALTDTRVRNVVTIEKGTYSIKLVKNQETGLYVRSNTTLILNGTIRLKPNSFTNYHVVEATGNSIVIKGTGSIVGDKDSHTGKSGEWGMGLDVARGNNVRISGLIIKDCWGDCIYIGDKSKNVIIDSCILVNGRRQGISITSADGVTVKNCHISKVSGTDPQYGIDVEPNKGCEVDNVLIENVVVTDCYGGISCWHDIGAKIGRVTVRNCKVSHTKAKYPVRLMRAGSVALTNCEVESESDYCVLLQDIEQLSTSDNKLNAKGRKPQNVINCKIKK